MSVKSFDPYHKWLGIPPEEQPPNHYRLLGIRLFETDRDVISHAADQRMIHVRSFQAGKNAKSSQQILNALAAARICLLKADKKAEYDAELRTKLATAGELAPPAPPLEPASPPTFSPASPPPPPVGFSPPALAESYPVPSPPSGPFAGLDMMPVPVGASPLAPATSPFDDAEQHEHASSGSLDDMLAAPRSLRSTAARSLGSRRSNDASLTTTIAIVSIIVLALIAGGIALVMNSSADTSDDESPPPAPIAPEPRREPHKSTDLKTPRPDTPARWKPGDPIKPLGPTPDVKHPSTGRGPLDKSNRPNVAPNTDAPSDNPRPQTTPATPGANDESPDQMDLKKSLEEPPK
jgi:hypothetical protein